MLGIPYVPMIVDDGEPVGDVLLMCGDCGQAASVVAWVENAENCPSCGSHAARFMDDDPPTGGIKG